MFDNPFGIVVSLLWFLALLEMQFLASETFTQIFSFFSKGKGAKASRLVSSWLLVPVVLTLSLLVHLPMVVMRLMGETRTGVGTGLLALITIALLISFYGYFQEDTVMGRYLVWGGPVSVSFDLESQLPENTEEIGIVARVAVGTFVATVFLNIVVYFLLY